ncbi:hypothetical protein HMPREF3224_02459, partial [Anaerococcus hydrogenalis]
MTKQSRIGGILMNWKKMTVTALIGLGVVGVLAGCGNDAKPAAGET